MGLQGSLEGDSRTLLAWQLALLRYAVPLDHADRMNVMAIAKEIDRGRRRADQQVSFSFFRTTSADLCAAIEHRNESADIVLRQYLARIDDDRLKRAFASIIEMDHQAPAAKKPKNDNSLWRGLSSSASALSSAR
jgi:hypothetical protein